MATCSCAKPPALRLEEARLKALGGTFLGICGDEHHTSGFHLPGCRLGSGDYSRRYGVGNPLWAAAIDAAMDFAHSRDWLVYTVAQAKAGRRPGLVEIIGQPAGHPILYWAAWHNWVPRVYSNQGHKHTHLGISRTVLANPAADLHLFDWKWGGTPPAAPRPAPTTSWDLEAIKMLPTVKRGSKGNYVRNLQGLLVANGRAIKVDGDFGGATEGALKAEQREYGIKVDGVCGQHSWATLIRRKKS